VLRGFYSQRVNYYQQTRAIFSAWNFLIDQRARFEQRVAYLIPQIRHEPKALSTRRGGESLRNK